MTRHRRHTLKGPNRTKEQVTGIPKPRVGTLNVCEGCHKPGGTLIKKDNKYYHKGCIPNTGVAMIFKGGRRA